MWASPANRCRWLFKVNARLVAYVINNIKCITRLSGSEMKKSRNDEPHNSEKQKTDTHSGRGLIKLLPLVFYSAGKHGDPEYE